MALTRLLPRPHGRAGTDRLYCGQGHRLRESEGRRREDDDDAEPRRRVRGAWEARAARRPRPAGQPDDEPGAEPRHDRALDVRRARPQAADLRGDRGTARSTSPSPRSTSPAPSWRSRALIGRERALEKALAAVREQLRLHPHRHAAVARPADDQRVRRRHRRHRAGAVRVPRRCAGSSSSRTRSRWCARTSTREVAIEGIVPTMYDGRTLHSREAVEILEENFGDLVYNTRIRKTVRYAEAPVKGSSVLALRPDGSGREHVPRPREGGARWRAKRASMREGPLAELFRATEAAQRQAEPARGRAERPGCDRACCSRAGGSGRSSTSRAGRTSVADVTPAPPPPRIESSPPPPAREPETPAPEPRSEPSSRRHLRPARPRPARRRRRAAPRYTEPPPVARYVEPLPEPARPPASRPARRQRRRISP